MRNSLGFNIEKEKLPKIEFKYSSQKFKQHVNIILENEDEINIDQLLEAFHKFISALGVSIPENVYIRFIEGDDESNGDEQTTL